MINRSNDSNINAGRPAKFHILICISQLNLYNVDCNIRPCSPVIRVKHSYSFLTWGKPVPLATTNGKVLDNHKEIIKINGSTDEMDQFISIIFLA